VNTFFLFSLSLFITDDPAAADDDDDDVDGTVHLE
jgi:hypothetical protein